MSDYKDYEYKFDNAFHTATTDHFKEDEVLESAAIYRPSMSLNSNDLTIVSSIPVLHNGEMEEVYLESGIGGMFDNFLSICAEDDFPDKMFSIALIQLKSLEKKLEEKIKSSGNVPMNDFIARLEPIREKEVLYDKSGLAVAIKSNGQILAIIEGDL